MIWCFWVVVYICVMFPSLVFGVCTGAAVLFVMFGKIVVLGFGLVFYGFWSGDLVFGFVDCVF